MKIDLFFSGQEDRNLYFGSEQGGSEDVSHAHFTVTERAPRGGSCGTPVPGVPENICF